MAPTLGVSQVQGVLGEEVLEGGLPLTTVFQEVLPTRVLREISTPKARAIPLVEKGADLPWGLLRDTGGHQKAVLFWKKVISEAIQA